MPLIPFPYVPNFPGVPALPRMVGIIIPTVVAASLGILQSMLIGAYQSPQQWGIYDAIGKPLTGSVGLSLVSDTTVSTISVDYAKETRVSDFPVERGGFASYNKVEMPGIPCVPLCLSGSPSDRTAFLNAIDAACKTTKLYSVVTPEVVYIGHTLERYNYRRARDKGATLLTVEIFLKEIRQVGAQYSTSPVKNPKDTGATPTTDTGNVQPSVPQQSILSQAHDKYMGAN